MTSGFAHSIILRILENREDGKQYPAGGREERERLVEAPGKPPEKSSRSGTAERQVSCDGSPSVIGEGRECAR